jgi:hypothetical protein
MRSILAWLALTLVVYGLGGLWLGSQARPAVERYEQSITQPVEAVTQALRR